MGRELYKRIAPHFQRVAYDAVHPTTRASELIGGDVGAAIALQNYLEEQKDDIRILYCPHLYGNRVRQSGNLNFVTKGYSANSPLKPSAERRNLLTWTEEFDNAAWIKFVGGTGVAPLVTPNTITSPIGTLNADRVYFSLNGGNTSNDQSILTYNYPVIPRIFSLYIKSNTLQNQLVYFRNGNGPITVLVTPEWKRYFVYSDSTFDAS